MPVLARADILYCLIGRLFSFSELTSLVDSVAGYQKKADGTPKGSGPRISASIQESWAMATSAIWIKKAGGPPGDYEVGIKTTRVDFRCYGAWGHEADNVWAMLDAILVPATGERMVSFVQGDCHVIDIRPEADAFADREPQTNYPYVWAPYIVTWRGVAA